MRGAPNWQKSGDYVDPHWKQELLIWLGKTFGLTEFVETGTCHGATVEAVHNEFEYIYTVELHKKLFAETSARLKHFGRVIFFQGDSLSFLEELWEDDIVTGKALFWLDAHPAGPTTADNGDPLPDELRFITQHYSDSLIVVDDMPGPELSHIVGIDEVLKGWTRDYRTGELILHRGGYAIPEFER